MSDLLIDIPPVPLPTGVATADQALQGPAIPPQHRILLYSPEEWENFIHEWIHYGLKTDYVDVQRFTGSGDRGVDIAAFVDEKKLEGLWDNYQCKQYRHKPLYPTDAWPEIGKVLWYTFRKAFAAPRNYFFVAPKGIGTTLNGYLNHATELKRQLFINWDKHVRNKIGEQEVILEGEFSEYVQAFDFSIFHGKSALQIIDEHRRCPHHAARFGGGLAARPLSQQPPNELAPVESKYIAHLLAAYEDHTSSPVPDVHAIPAGKLKKHFGRQREAFYHAESLRIFARDNVPPGTFEQFQETIFQGVIDTHDADHADGYVRVCSVTKAARDLQITSNALITRSEPTDRDGICHQLANEDRLGWTKS